MIETITAAEIATMKTIELRKLAREFGIKGVSSARKEQLLPLIGAKIEERDAKLAEEAKAAHEAEKALTSKNICRICSTRSIGTGKGNVNDRSQARTLKLCVPCLEEAEWENAHSDNGHESDPTAYLSDDCWICHPELNLAKKDAKVSRGTSRAGMKINVPLRAAGVAKANVVADKVDYATRIQENKDNTQLILTHAGRVSFTLTWDAAGRYDYPNSTITIDGKTRKVRNVSQLLQILKGLKG